MMRTEPGDVPQDTTYPPLPPMREELPTLPFDLSEYAREHAGPDDDDLLGEISVGPLLDVRGDSIPRLTVPRDELMTWALDHREGFIVSLLDGVSTVEAILDMAAMPEGQGLFVLCDLCARGLVALD
jgi:hypothetical protein